MMIAQQHASTADAAATSPEALRSLAEYLTRARLATRLTFRDVCDRTGIPLGYLSRLEAGQVREPSPRALWRLAHVYGADYAALMRLAGDVGAAPGTVPGLDELTPDDRMEIVGIIQLKLRRYRHGSSRTRSQTGSQRTRRRATPPDTFVDEAAAALTKLHAAYTAPALPHPGRALGYIRLDRAGLAGRADLDSQKHELDRWAAVHRANGLRTYVDTAPPSVPAAKRPALQKLLADVAAGRAETVVCTTLGRLATDRATREEIGAQIAAHGVRLVTTEQEIASAGSAVSTGVAGSARRRQQ